MNSYVGANKSRADNTTETIAIELGVIRTARKSRSNRAFGKAITACEILADLIVTVVSIVLGYSAYYFLDLGRHISYRPHTVVVGAFGFAILIVLMLDRAGAYSRGNSLLRVRETEQVLRVSGEAFLIVLAISFSSGVLFSRWLLVFCSALVPLTLFVEKTLLYLLVSTLHARGFGNERVLIYGAGHTGRRVFSTLRRSPRLGFEPVLLVDDDASKAGRPVFEMGYGRRRCAPVIRGPISAGMLKQHDIDSIIVAIPSIGREKFLRVVKEASHSKVRLSFVPNHFLSSDSVLEYQDIDGVLLGSYGPGERKKAYEIVKRCLDVLFTIVLLVLGAPFFLLLALLIRLDSPGPAIFKQKRVGQHEKPFWMYKFRTMYLQASQDDYSPKTQHDPRITTFGRFLRKTSLDELPQLLNVLEGTMSLVGPRPEMPFIVAKYGDKERQRLQVKPGLTGLWQLSGDRAFLIHENLEYDLYYIRHRNFFMDLAVLLHTSIFAMRGI
jgi:exopolysaccharide biosynthesis polyprenyl glycosylphosphotransferase